MKLYIDEKIQYEGYYALKSLNILKVVVIKRNTIRAVHLMS